MLAITGALANGRYLLCPDGRHLALYDDQQVYCEGLLQFIRDVAAGRA
jgi:proline iminopeptidase